MNEYLQLLQVPVKPSNDFYTICDILTNGPTLNGEVINILAVVRQVPCFLIPSTFEELSGILLVNSSAHKRIHGMQFLFIQTEGLFGYIILFKSKFSHWIVSGKWMAGHTLAEQSVNYLFGNHDAL